MARDCFGNPTPFPPSISDTHADIARYRAIPLSQRMEYHYARTDAMTGHGTLARAWELYRAIEDACPVHGPPPEGLQCCDRCERSPGAQA